MEELFWSFFSASGNINAYLAYKEMQQNNTLNADKHFIDNDIEI